MEGYSSLLVCLCVCVCVCLQSSSTSARLGTGNVIRWLKLLSRLGICVLSPGHRPMASLGIYQACIPAEALQTSQGREPFAHRVSLLKLGTWNVQSMVDTDGSVEVASQLADGQRGEERKVDQIVCELERYDVVVGALHETKWFGSEVYEVGGSVLLTSGRVTPASGEAVQRGEGVALVL